MAPVLWFLLGGAAGAALTAKVATVVGVGSAMAGSVVAVAAIRKKLSPQAQAEFDAAFAGLTPEQVLAVVNNEHDPDVVRLGQIVRQQLAHREQWMAMLRESPHAVPSQLHATAGAWMGHGPVYAAGAIGGPYVEAQQWARSSPEFLAWSKAQGPGWIRLLDSLGEVSPDHWSELARAYSVQMNYMAQRWPDGMAYLNAALAEGVEHPPSHVHRHYQLVNGPPGGYERAIAATGYWPQDIGHSKC
jgi:hypothetical protein